MRRLKSLVCEEEASELVEFAVAATIFFTLIFGIIEFCMAVYASSFVAFAAQQGTRYAMVRGADWKTACSSSTSNFGCLAAQSDIQNYILGLPHPGLGLTASNISVPPMTTTAAGTTCTAFTQGCQVKVTVSYTFRLNVPFVSGSVPISSTSIETIQD
jgi:Flp pilus assembly protein TadG